MENILDFVKEKWKLLTAFSRKEDIKQQLWEEIQYLYSAQHRHYHNLSHIAHLFHICDRYRSLVKNDALVGFAILYHDVIYDTYRNDNEEQSAALAETHMSLLNIKAPFIESVKFFILATKSHQVPENYEYANDLALFLDFDMAILAAEPEMYSTYSENIRQEYSKYGNHIYNEGRKLALQQVLATPNIFNSQQFREEMELSARQNIQREIDKL